MLYIFSCKKTWSSASKMKNQGDAWERAHLEIRTTLLECTSDYMVLLSFSFLYYCFQLSLSITESDLPLLLGLKLLHLENDLSVIWQAHYRLWQCNGWVHSEALIRLRWTFSVLNYPFGNFLSILDILPPMSHWGIMCIMFCT